MSYNPGPSWFIRFDQLDPSRDRQCIFFTQKGLRCRATCTEEDNIRAIQLWRQIRAASHEILTAELIQDYILSICCRFGRAQHHDRIEDINLLIPLAQRWQIEILARLAPLTPASPPTRLTADLPVAASSSLKNQLSEFRPHIAKPGPDETLPWKIKEILQGRDSETGSIYIFNRPSSPGHIKIGWTARSVSQRLETWAKCGYTPNLLFTADDVPHAQRAETLIHFELIKEWRRERSCNVCGKSHREWFEISIERGKQVASNWVELFKTAELYSKYGYLKPHYVRIVSSLEKNGEAVTAGRLLACHKMLSGPGQAYFDQANVMRTVKIEETNQPSISEQGKVEIVGERPMLDGTAFPNDSLAKHAASSMAHDPALVTASKTSQSSHEDPKQCKADDEVSGEQISSADLPKRSEAIPSRDILTSVEVKGQADSEPFIETEADRGLEQIAEPAVRIKIEYEKEVILNTDMSLLDELSPERIALPPSPVIEPKTVSDTTGPIKEDTAHDSERRQGSALSEPQPEEPLELPSVPTHEPSLDERPKDSWSLTVMQHAHSLKVLGDAKALVVRAEAC